MGQKRKCYFAASARSLSAFASNSLRLPHPSRSPNGQVGGVLLGVAIDLHGPVCERDIGIVLGLHGVSTRVDHLLAGDNEPHPCEGILGLSRDRGITPALAQPRTPS
jgi:hypothetical protein